MFRVISPFVLAHELQNDDGQRFDVENIRSDADGNVRLLLRRESDGTPCSQALAKILNWKITLGTGRQKSIAGHLDSCFREIHQWLAKCTAKELQWEAATGQRAPARMPGSFRWGVLLDLEQETKPKACRQILLDWLNEDRKLWHAKIVVTARVSKRKRSFLIKAQHVSNHGSFSSCLQAAYRAAERNMSSSGDVLDVETSFGSYVIAAIEEYCHECVRESLQSISSGKREFTDTHIACTVAIESCLKTPKRRIRVEEQYDATVRIILPYTTSQQTKLVNVRVMPFQKELGLYDALRKEAKRRHSIFRDRIVELKQALDSLPPPSGLVFGDNQGFDAWLEANIKPDNPNLANSLAAIVMWVRAGYKELSQRGRKAAEESLVTHIRLLISSLSPSYRYRGARKPKPKVETVPKKSKTEVVYASRNMLYLRTEDPGEKTKGSQRIQEIESKSRLRLQPGGSPKSRRWWSLISRRRR